MFPTRYRDRLEHAETLEPAGWQSLPFSRNFWVSSLTRVALFLSPRRSSCKNPYRIHPIAALHWKPILNDIHKVCLPLKKMNFYSSTLYPYSASRKSQSAGETLSHNNPTHTPIALLTSWTSILSIPYKAPAQTAFASEDNIFLHPLLRLTAK